MNPVSLDAIKLLLDMKALNPNDIEYGKRLDKIVESLLFIIEKDVEQAFQKYSSVKLV